MEERRGYSEWQAESKSVIVVLVHGHFARDKNCPAVGKACKKCKKTGHFAVVCKTQSSNRDTEQRGKGLKVKQVSTEEERKAKDDYDDDEYAFTIGSKQSQGECKCCGSRCWWSGCEGCVNRLGAHLVMLLINRRGKV